MIIIKNELFEIKLLSNSNDQDLLYVYSQCEDFFVLGPVQSASLEMIPADIKHSAKENGRFCGIYLEHNLVGVVDFIPNNYEGNPEIAFISLLMIALPYRNNGLGAKVIQALEEKIGMDFFVNTIQTAVQVNNINGIRFWKRVGYDITSEPIICPDTTIVYILEKKLK